MQQKSKHQPNFLSRLKLALSSPLHPIYAALIAMVLGACSVLGFAPYYVFPVPIIALMALFYLCLKTDTLRGAWILGFSYGLGLYGVGIYWIYISLHTFGGMPWWFAGFCTFCLCAFMALFPALVTYWCKRLGFFILSAPVLWGVSDWVRSWIFTGFPWLTLGYSQVPHSPLAGYLPIIGVYGVSVLTALIAAILAYWIANPQQTARLKRQTIACVTMLLTAGLGLKAVEWAKPVAKPISVALLQGNISQEIKWSPDVAQSTIAMYWNMVKNTKADLIVLPETALPVIASELDPAIKTKLTQHARAQGGNIVIGLVQHGVQYSTQNTEANDSTLTYYNSAISFGSDPTQTYSKNHLVPFGEFIPLKFALGWIYRDWLNMPLSDLSRGGTQQKPMQLGTQKIAVNICYEDVFGEEIIRQLPAATMLVNISNDAWYGQSFAADQHMQFSQARAIETGRMALRATNTGATALIDQHGIVLAHAPHDEKNILLANAQGYQGTTPYVRWGNWPVVLLFLAYVLFLISKKVAIENRQNKQR
jgi:apolipoprotein N-acyltransferase